MATRRCSENFAFHEWAFLARVDPEAFETRRRATIAEFIADSGARNGVGNSLQAEIDAVRQRAGDPQSALLAIFDMMRRRLDRLGDEIENLRDEFQPSRSDRPDCR